MKTLLKLFCTIFLSVLLFGCVEKKEITCEPLDEKYAMFIPNMELNDSITFYSNKGDSLVFSYSAGAIMLTLSGHTEGECSNAFEANYISKEKHLVISHSLGYSGNNPDEIDVRICFHGINFYEESNSFVYNPKNNPVTISVPIGALSVPIEDSIPVNGIYYKDVVIVNTRNSSDKVYFDKIYVAKDHGLIMFTVKDSDIVWAINKFE